jgi:hypothetical protein
MAFAFFAFIGWGTAILSNHRHLEEYLRPKSRFPNQDDGRFDFKYRQ